MNARTFSTLAIVAATIVAVATRAFGQSAVAVVSYTPGVLQAAGEVGPPLYANPATALGLPDDLSGETGLNPFGSVFPNVLSPLSPPYEADEVVEIGPGGQLTLRLSHYALAGPGLSLGVFANAGLIGNYDPETFAFLGVANPAGTFGAESAVLEVSENGGSWVTLNGGAQILFDMPANHYKNAGVFDAAPPASPQLANFQLPIAPDLSIFDGQSEAGLLAALGDSAGGYWLDLSATGLTQVGYLRFSVPLSALPTEPYGPGDLDNVVFELDAVSIARGALGAPTVPEPATNTLIATLLISWTACVRTSRPSRG
jgi:hypothetical protein